MVNFLVTGAAGFIGSALIRALFEKEEDINIVGIDNINDYYNPQLKRDRLDALKHYSRFSFKKIDLSCKNKVLHLFKRHKFDIVINLAAQAGVRYSINHPDEYIKSNIIGFFNVLEACRYYPVNHLIYASSSSVYGLNKKIPYSTNDKTDNPVSLYAATKKSNELLAYAYSKLYGFPTTGLRFFTVYGPMGRPDMAYFKFTDKIAKGEKIQLFNNGDMYRDFTYIDDIVNGIAKVIKRLPPPDENGIRYKIYNIGNNSPVTLRYFVDTLTECLAKADLLQGEIKIEYLPMQPGDVYQTYADVDDLINDFDWKPSTSLKDGLTKFVEWYKKYYFMRKKI